MLEPIIQGPYEVHRSFDGFRVQSIEGHHIAGIVASHLDSVEIPSRFVVARETMIAVALMPRMLSIVTRLDRISKATTEQEILRIIEDAHEILALARKASDTLQTKERTRPL